MTNLEQYATIGTSVISSRRRSDGEHLNGVGVNEESSEWTPKAAAGEAGMGMRRQTEGDVNGVMDSFVSGVQERKEQRERERKVWDKENRGSGGRAKKGSSSLEPPRHRVGTLSKQATKRQRWNAACNAANSERDFRYPTPLLCSFRSPSRTPFPLFVYSSPLSS